MNVNQRIQIIKLNEKLLNNPVYAQKLGIEITIKNNIQHSEYNILRGENNVWGINDNSFGYSVRKGCELAFKMTWGITKIIATVLLVCAVPALVLGLIFAGGLLLLLPVGLIAGAILLLKFL